MILSEQYKFYFMVLANFIIIALFGLVPLQHYFYQKMKKKKYDLLERILFLIVIAPIGISAL